MRGVNKSIIIGRLGNDPEISYTADGKAVAKLSVATSEKWKDKQGQQQERTEWHRISAFGRLAEIMGEYLRKGSQVYIEGKLRTNRWKDKDGNDRYTTEILANEMQMLGQSGSANGQSAGAQRQQAPNQSYAPSTDFFDEFDDSVPF